MDNTRFIYFFALNNKYPGIENHSAPTLMIKSFRCPESHWLFETGKSRKFQNIRTVAERKFVQLAAARELRDLVSPPGDQLEALAGDRTGQYSIRINKQWRVCFIWTDEGAEAVEAADYH